MTDDPRTFNVNPDRSQTKNSAAIMRIINYPPHIGPVSDDYVGIGSHSE